MLRLKDFSRSRAVTYSAKVVISWQRCKNETLMLQNTNRKWFTAHQTAPSIYDDLEWPSRLSSTYCKSFQVSFLVRLCSSWQEFNWHRASRGPSATPEILVNKSPRVLSQISHRAFFSISNHSGCRAVLHRVHNEKNGSLAYWCCYCNSWNSRLSSETFILFLTESKLRCLIILHKGMPTVLFRLTTHNVLSRSLIQQSYFRQLCTQDFILGV